MTLIKEIRIRWQLYYLPAKEAGQNGPNSQSGKYHNQLGDIQQLRGQNFAIFWPPPLPCVDSFLNPERGQKHTFFDPLILTT